ncbi:MAG: hypothetical protein AAGK25_12890, partial [Pseudomonadota bacterium]
NIMYSGFIATQMMCARRTNNHDSNVAPLTLRCRNATEKTANPVYQYTLDQLVDTLARQYKSAPLGLLACEPHWVYPLCNLITATALKGYETQTGNAAWSPLRDRFFHALDTEFTTRNGQFLPFRSSLTGLAPPQIGGAVMQAFPCFFLNALDRGLAQRKWSALKHCLKGGDWSRVLWPVDVGNYGFSRASSYAATALAAREVGDDETASQLLELFDATYQKCDVDGVCHHENASLWAHAVRFAALVGKADMLHRLVNDPLAEDATGPHLAHAPYPDVLIAQALSGEKSSAFDLRLVLYPDGEAARFPLTFGGLVPFARYRIKNNQYSDEEIGADHKGALNITVPLSGRTVILLKRLT